MILSPSMHVWRNTPDALRFLQAPMRIASSLIDCDELWIEETFIGLVVPWRRVRWHHGSRESQEI